MSKSNPTKAQSHYSMCLSQTPILSSHHGLPPRHQLSPPTPIPTTTESCPPPRLTFSKWKLSYIHLHNKQNRERKKELQWAVEWSGVEWMENDEEKMAVVESWRCEQLRVTMSGFGFQICDFFFFLMVRFVRLVISDLWAIWVGLGYKFVDLGLEFWRDLDLELDWTKFFNRFGIKIGWAKDWDSFFFFFFKL